MYKNETVKTVVKGEGVDKNGKYSHDLRFEVTTKYNERGQVIERKEKKLND